MHYAYGKVSMGGVAIRISNFVSCLEENITFTFIFFSFASKFWKWAKFIIFQTLNAIFAYKGVFFTNVQKANIIALIKTIFGTHFVCDFTFFAFSPLACQLKKIIPRFLGVKKAWCKNLYIFGENWQRNQISKVDYFMIAFSLMPQLSHSAMWYLCYESWCLQLSMCTLCWKFADVTLADGWW